MRRSQRGVVLIIALIILVAMTLAGIGMMRSVDTGSLVAGNMAFQRSTMNASDAGTSAGFNDLMQVANSGNLADRAILQYDNGKPCTGAPGATAAPCAGGGNINFPGYYSTPIYPCEVTETCAQASNYKWWTDNAVWTSTTHPPATVPIPDPNSNGGTMTVKYFIHRMCQVPNAAPSATPFAGQLCQSFTPPGSTCGGSPIGGSCTDNQPLTPFTVYYYRVTVQVTGPRNTVSYAQTIIQQQS